MKVAVIGGGPNGVITANELLEQLPGVSIDLYGRGDSWGHGLVYGEQELASSRQSFVTREMGVDPHDQRALADWVSDHREKLQEAYSAGSLEESSYPPRRLVGRYFGDRVDVALERARTSSSDLQLISDPVISIRGSRPFTLETECGRARKADYVFLCLGNFPSNWGVDLAGMPGYHPEIWGTDFFGEISDQDDVLVVGSGLSSIDVLFGLNGAGHEGRVCFASRRAMLPSVQGERISLQPPKNLMQLVSSGDPLSLDELEHALDAAARSLGSEEEFWGAHMPRALMPDTKKESPAQAIARVLAPYMPNIWRRLPVEDRKDFDSRHGSLWNALHLPMAPHSADLLRKEMRSGRLQVGQLHGVDSNEGKFIATIDGRDQRFDAVINATGRNLDVSSISDPLVQDLLSTGLLRQHELGGFDVDFNTSRSGDIFVIGPLTRGVHFYTYVLSENACKAHEAVASIADRECR